LYFCFDGRWTVLCRLCRVLRYGEVVIFRQVIPIPREKGSIGVSRNIFFLFLCWDGCRTVMYRLRKVVRQLNPILPEEASMGVSRKKFFVFSLGWLLNGDVTVVEVSTAPVCVTPCSLV
jgi:hypothetical protein